MNIRRYSLLRTALLLPVMLLPACATIINGTSEDVAVSTSPPGAACAVDRAGARLGVVAQTPGSLHVEKSKNDLTVTCGKAGFQTAAVTRSPSFSLMTLGNLVVGGAIGIGVDFATGANYQYRGDIRLDLAGDPGYGPPPFALQVPQLDPHAMTSVRQYGPPAAVLPDTVAMHAASY
ncbi:MAG TPA: hypothetical protein VGC15_17855 [Acetobacteraceae bacterium]